MNPPRKALMVQLRRIGDVLMCTPAIRAFKKKYPECRLDFLTELPDVLAGNPNLNGIIPVDRSRQYDPLYQYSLIRGVRKSRYDIVIDFFANPRSANYSFLSGAPVRLSYGYGHRRWAYNLVPRKSSEPVYAAMDRLNLLQAVEVYSNDCRLDFFPADSDREEAAKLLSGAEPPIATISPVSRRAFNRWPLERYAEICRALAEKCDYTILVLAGPGEEDRAAELGRLLDSINVITIPLKSLGILGAVFERTEIHIGNDNGPKHIAVARGAPTFTIYGPHSHISWTYPESSRHGYIIPADVDPDCRSTDHACGNECILKITVEAVWERLSPMIENIRASRSSVEIP